MKCRLTYQLYDGGIRQYVCMYVRMYVCMYECVCVFCLSSKILVFVTSVYVNNCQNNVATFRSHVCLGSLGSDEPCCEVRSVDSLQYRLFIFPT